MTIKLETLTHTIDAAPGEIVNGMVRLSNESEDDAVVSIRVIGVGPASVDDSLNGQTVHLPAGETLDVDVSIAVPELLGIGQHAAAFEVRTGLKGFQPLLGPFILSVPSVERILIETLPSTIRGKRRPKFILDLTNNESEPVNFVVEGSALKVRVRFEKDSFELAPGERASTRAKVRGPRRVFGQTTQHNLLLSARGIASSTAITAPYIQRPLIAARIRSVVAAITVVALWAGGMVGLYRWDSGKKADLAAESSLTVDADGTAQESASPSDSAAEGSEPANNSDNTAEAEGGEPSSNSDNTAGDDATGDDATSESSDPAAGSSPISTSVTGTIKLEANEGESAADALAGVVIKLRELQLGEAAPAASVPVGFAARKASQPTKIWSARRSAVSSELGRIRQTVPVTRAELPNGIGIWLFGEVQLQRTYELAFQKAGYQSQSFVIEPADDGALVEVNVNLAPGEGSIVGTLTGPPVGQRNAAITITDGTIEYSTTTDSDTGSWRIEGLSTPAVYTLTATLPGYGTVVQQVSLDTGEEDKPADVVMQAGVSTVRGQVFGPDGGVGGAVVTVSGRGEPRTTTTLTEGDIGAFSLSGFDIDNENPQVATIVVEQDGFNRESTTRVLDRSDVSGVNFLLTGDRLRLSGVVRSSDNDEPLAGASLELATGDLTFSAQTSSGSDAGEFTVADLPPGDYVITVSAYEYVESYEFVTLVGGTPPENLDVTLQKVDPADLSNQLRGDLIVSVIDKEAATQGAREITNAEVRLVETSSGAPVDFIESESSNEVRYTVPLGTYTVIVTHEDYNPAPRREVTIGLAGETIEVELQKKLKSSARVVDSVSGLALLGYELSVFQQPDVAGQSEREITVTINQVDGSWETDEALPTGSYRVEASLDGYRIRDDQVLDPTLTAGDKGFRFQINESLSEKLILNDIRADPYAEVSGRVFKPTVDPLGRVGFEPIDEPLLEVTMECTGRSPGALSKEAPAALTDELDALGTDLYDTFTFPRNTYPIQQLDKANCTIDAGAGPGYTPVTPISFSNLTVSSGSAYTDRIVNFALTKPLVNAFKGTTFWVDPRNGQSIPVGGVTLTSLGVGAIVDFTANIAGPEQTELMPEPTFALLTTQGDSATGAWQFNGPENQLIGQTLYRVEAPSGGFANGTIKVTVDGDGIRTVEAESGAVVTGSDAAGFGIELFPPLPGTLSGTVEILSIDTNFSNVTVDGYAPTNDPALIALPATATPDQTVTASPGAFEFLSADAGTWTVDFTAPPNHEFLVAAESSVDVLVPPKETNTPFTTKLVELGQIDLTLNSSTGGAAPPPPTVAATEGGVALTAAPTVVEAAPGPYKVQGFPVTVVDTGTATVYSTRNYDVTFEAAGFDHESADVVFADTSLNQSDSIDVPFAIQAGSKIPVTITMEPYGFIRGLIQGDRASGAAGLDITQAGTGGETVLDIQYSKTANGTFADSSIEPTKPTSAVAGTFDLTGPPGYYRIAVTHPEFEPTPTTIPSDSFPNPGLTAGDFGLVNILTRNTTDPWELRERRTDLELKVFASTSATATLDTHYKLTPTDTTLDTIEGNCTAQTDGSACIINELRGLQEYTLLITDTGTTPAFPAMTTVVAPQNSSASATKVVEVTAVLVPINETLTVEVVGKNADGRLVAAPNSGDVTLAVTSVDVSASANEIFVDDNTTPIGGTYKPNVAGTTFTPPTANITVASTVGDAHSYEFSPMPSGIHTVTATSQPPGYRALDTNLANFTVPTGGSTTQFVYVAENVTLTAVLADASGGGDYPNLSWTLSSTSVSYTSAGYTCNSISPHPTSCPSPAWSFDEATNRLTILGVQPELNNFTLTISDDLHTPTTSSPFNIPVGGDTAGSGTTDIGTVLKLADAARLSGAITQSNGTILEPSTGYSLVLKNSAGATVSLPDEAPTADGLHQGTISLTSASTFSFIVSKTNYGTIETPVTMQPGRVTTINANLREVATVTVTVAGAAAGTSPMVTPPPGLDVYLTSGGVRVTPISVTGTDTSMYTFTVPSNVEYSANATANDYQAHGPIFTDPTAFTPTIAGSTASIVALTRLVLVTVTGPTSATLSNSFGTTEASPGRFEFLPGTTGATGTGTLRIEATGYRTREIVIPDELFTPASVDLLPTVTVSGTLKDSAGDDVAAGIQVLVTSPGQVSLTGTTTLGNYSVGGLHVGPNGEALDWEVEFPAAYAVTSGVVEYQVTGTSPTADTPQPIVLDVI